MSSDNKEETNKYNKLNTLRKLNFVNQARKEEGFFDTDKNKTKVDRALTA